MIAKKENHHLGYDTRYEPCRCLPANHHHPPTTIPSFPSLFTSTLAWSELLRKRFLSDLAREITFLCNICVQIILVVGHPSVGPPPPGGCLGDDVRRGLSDSWPGLAVGPQSLPDGLLSPLHHPLHSTSSLASLVTLQYILGQMFSCLEGDQLKCNKIKEINHSNFCFIAR